MPMVLGIDHGYYAIKTPHICFPTGLSVYDYEPYTIQNVLQMRGIFMSAEQAGKLWWKIRRQMTIIIYWQWPHWHRNSASVRPTIKQRLSLRQACRWFLIGKWYSFLFEEKHKWREQCKIRIIKNRPDLKAERFFWTFSLSTELKSW